jgi:death-on-curing protein
MNSPWIWLDLAVLRAAHEEQLLEHGGAPGTRDEGLRESAAARPRHLSSYGSPDLADLAAAYGFGIARNHPFIDGNKRTALVAIETFLLLNGAELSATDAECVLTVLALAAGDLDEAALADWIRRHMSGISS